MQKVPGGCGALDGLYLSMTTTACGTRHFLFLSEENGSDSPRLLVVVSTHIPQAPHNACVRTTVTGFIIKAMNEDKVVKISLPYEWMLQKTLGPTLDEIGKDIASLYGKGVKKINEAAQRKIENIDDGARANLRVARDVFFNGSFSENDISAEYFGGILAASRTNDGKDDGAIFYLDIVKSLSSSQLKLHYLVYRHLNELLAADKARSDFNPARSEHVSSLEIHFLSGELSQVGVNLESDLLALNHKDLISNFEYSADMDPDKVISVTKIVPTSLGIQLFAVSANKMNHWREYAQKHLDTHGDQIERVHAALSLVELLDMPLVKFAKAARRKKTVPKATEVARKS
jgi:hypothetical protein